MVKRRKPTRFPDDAAMEANGHHLGFTGTSFKVQCVEGILQMLFKGTW